MINEQQLAQLRKFFQDPQTHNSLILRDAFHQMADTMEALWKVMRAAEDFNAAYESEDDNVEVRLKLKDALAALKEKT